MGVLDDKHAEVKPLSRQVYTYNVPVKIPGDVRSVGVVELTADEELQATKRSRGDTFRLAYELAKQSLVEVNGEKVSLMDGSADAIWAKMNPKLRNLVLAAYSDIHTPTEEDAALFLKTRVTQVG
jgi:hypothetical protein